MALVTGGVIGTLEADNLIAGIYPPAIAHIFTLTTSAVIERGTVLSRESDGTYAVLGAGSGTASVVVAETTLEDDTEVEAYVSGYFYRDQLIFSSDDYELTEEDENNLRLAGILLTDSAEEVIQKTEAEDDTEDETEDETEETTDETESET
ncbi:MAG: hypothetical protein LUG45_00875 [Clostridiales bacterium]|nr:hypothetical protein [Clostridiales bacterium]